MNIRMMNKKLLVEPLKEQNKTDGGILLPDSATHRGVDRGRVVAASLDLSGNPCSVWPKEGEEILYDSTTSLKVKIEGKDLELVSESQIYGIFLSNEN